MAGPSCAPRRLLGVEWAAQGKVTLEGPDRRGERRFLPWPYYNHEG